MGVGSDHVPKQLSSTIICLLFYIVPNYIGISCWIQIIYIEWLRNWPPQPSYFHQLHFEKFSLNNKKKTNLTFSNLCYNLALCLMIFLALFYFILFGKLLSKTMLLNYGFEGHLQVSADKIIHLKQKTKRKRPLFGH